jgi:hypothetical protein
MIIGGQAVLLYGTPRMTRDIDITLGIDTDKYSLIEVICKKVRLKILPKNPKSFAQETKVLPAEDTKLRLRVDFIFSNTPYERQAINRAAKVKIKNYLIRFASVEDLIIHKMFAGRAIDLEDVKNILLKQRQKVDIKYMKKWLRKFSELPEQKDILKRLERILKTV